MDGLELLVARLEKYDSEFDHTLWPDGWDVMVAKNNATYRSLLDIGAEYGDNTGHWTEED